MKEKARTLLQQHAVVTFHRNKDVYKLFLTPGAFLEYRVAGYTKDGWEVSSIDLLDREGYLNAKIADLVDGYEDICHERKNLRDKFRSGKLDFETYMTSRTITNELLESDMRRLYLLMNRLTKEGFECRNEDAKSIYDLAF